MTTNQLQLPGTGVTGQDIHEAYLQIETWPEDVRTDYERMGISQGLKDWQHLAESARHLYNQVADLLNKKLAQAEQREAV